MIKLIHCLRRLYHARGASILIFLCFCVVQLSSQHAVVHADDERTPFFHGRSGGQLSKEAIDSYLSRGKRELSGIEPEQLRYQINRIYAFYGYPFQKPEVRALFSFPGSPYREDPHFTEDKIPSDHRKFIEYLLKVEKWKLRLAQKRSQGLLDYERTEEGRQETFEGLGALTAVDRRQNVSFMIDNTHLLVLQYPDGIPIGQVKLPAAISQASDFSAALSPNGKYLAFNYYSSSDSKYIILLIDAVAPAVLHKIQAGFGEVHSHAQFDSSSTMLYTSAGAYDIVTGKKIKKWTYPTDHTIRNIDDVITMFDGRLRDGSLLFGCWALNRIYRVDPAVGVYTVFVDLDKEGLSMPDAKINDDKDLMAGVVRKTALVGNQQTVVRSDFVIWKVLPDNTLQRMYTEEIAKDQELAKWSWGKRNTILKTTGGKGSLNKLWRYDINGEKVTLTHIPIEGLFGGQGRISLGTYFVVTYGRLWDIESGRKVTPWYEAFDPFDASNRLPLYDERPSAVQLKDFWRD